MKKIIYVLMLVLMAGTLFAAGQADAADDSEKLTELIWYVPGGPYTDSAVVYDALNEMFNRDLGINVEIKATGGFGEYRETMPLAMASGEKFDLVWTASWCNTFLDAATDGLYAPLDELLPKYAPTIWKDTGDSLEATRVDGKIRAVWAQQIAAYTSNVILRQPLIDKYGWDVSTIQTIQDIEPFLADIKANEPDLIPLSTRQPLSIWQLPFLQYAGLGVIEPILAVRVEDETVTVFNLLEDPEYIAIIELAWDWYQKGYIAKDGLTYNNDQWTQMANAGKIGIDVHNTWVPGSEVSTSPYGELTFRVPFGQSFQNTNNITSTLNAVSAASDNKEAAVRLLEYLWTNEEAYNALVWGLSGKHYEELEGGFIRPNPDSGYYTNMPWVFGNTFMSYLKEGQNPEANALVYDLNQNAKKASVMGFIINLEDIQTLVASIDTVREQYNNAVCSGYMDPAVELPKYQAELKKAGIDELIAEVQAQIDAWLATK